MKDVQPELLIVCTRDVHAESNFPFVGKANQWRPPSINIQQVSLPALLNRPLYLHDVILDCRASVRSRTYPKRQLIDTTAHDLD